MRASALPWSVSALAPTPMHCYAPRVAAISQAILSCTAGCAESGIAQHGLASRALGGAANKKGTCDAP